MKILAPERVCACDCSYALLRVVGFESLFDSIPAEDHSDDCSLFHWASFLAQTQGGQ